MQEGNPGRPLCRLSTIGAVAADGTVPLYSSVTTGLNMAFTAAAAAAK